MPIKDVVLPLVGEPTEATIAAINKCVAVAGDLGANICAVAVEEDILVRPQVISNDLDNSAAAEAVRSVTDAQGLLKAFDSAAIRFGLRNEQKLVRWAAADIAPSLAKYARLKDLSFVPVKSHESRSEKIIEQLLFQSGRPILLCPEQRAAELPVAFNDVLIAWDHSAPAARAVADALPVLQSAETVRIITATDDRTADEMRSGADLVTHLAEHGIMGGYGRTRLSEMMWGGATKTVIGQPPCWVMMSR
jgi:nucleotide-binding universal stress UspA family protein